jgi:H+-transporting ATPase
VILWAALASRAEDKDTIDLAVIGGVKDDKSAEELQGTSLSALRSGA